MIDLAHAAAISGGMLVGYAIFRVVISDWLENMIRILRPRFPGNAKLVEDTVSPTRHHHNDVGDAVTVHIRHVVNGYVITMQDDHDHHVVRASEHFSCTRVVSQDEDVFAVIKAMIVERMVLK